MGSSVRTADLGVLGSPAGVGSSARPFLALADFGILGSTAGVDCSLRTLRDLADLGVLGSSVRAGSSSTPGS